MSTIYINSEKWKDIHKHLDRNRLLQEAIDEEVAHKKSIKDKSAAMTSQWENSVENIRLRKEAERQQKLIEGNEKKVKRFYELRKEQEAVKSKYIEKVKKSMFENKICSRNLNSALLFSEVLYERGKQLEFNDMLKKHEIEEKDIEDNRIIEDVKLYEKETADKNTKHLDIQKNYGQILQQQKKEIEDSIARERKQRIEKEIIDNKRADEEMETIKRIEYEEKKQYQKELNQITKKVLKQKAEKAALLNKEDQELDEIIDIQAKAKHRIACLRRAKEKEIREATAKKQEEFGKRLASNQQAKADEEETRLKAAAAERDANEESQRLAKKIHLLELKNDRIEDRRQYLKRLEREKQDEETMKRWEMLNRFKANEAMKEHDQQEANKRWQKVLEYREILLKMRAEKDEQIKYEIFMNNDFDKSDNDYKEEDKQFLEYAEEIMEFAKSRGRTTYPIEKTIWKYKEDNGLLPKSDNIKLPKHCKCKNGKKCNSK